MLIFEHSEIFHNYMRIAISAPSNTPVIKELMVNILIYGKFVNCGLKSSILSNDEVLLNTGSTSAIPPNKKNNSQTLAHFIPKT